jgi:hypothetical protein
MSVEQLTEADGMRERAWNRALAQAEDAIRANEHKLDEPKRLDRDGNHVGGYDCCGCSTYGYEFDDAIAAVRSLRTDLPAEERTS